MESLVNKAALGDLTLGEVWDLVKDRVHLVRIEEPGFTWGPYDNVSLTPRVRLAFSSHPFGDWDESFEPDYSFDLKTKVKVKEDHLEFVHEDRFGGEEKVSLYFMFRPEPETMRLDFLLPGACE